MSMWMKIRPEDFWSDPFVETLTLEEAGFMWWMLCRQWTHGSIQDNPALYRKLMVGKTRKFQKLWTLTKGHLLSAKCNDVSSLLTNQAHELSRRRHDDSVRKREKRHSESPVRENEEGVRTPSADCPQDVRNLSAPRTEQNRKKRARSANAPSLYTEPIQKKERKPVDPKVGAFQDSVTQEFRVRFHKATGERFEMAAKDYAARKRLYAMVDGNLEAVLGRMDAYFARPDNARFGFGLATFISQWNTYASAKPISKSTGKPYQGPEVL